ncbi:MAG TPA: hypothetical protein VEK57_08835 [Thermoanaerobaculia bacterium]|nr:hypothetical protein [Thermoanaerobaculia bacterium]
MVPTRDKPPDADEDAYYERYFPALVILGTQELQLSQEAAEALAHEVLMASIRHLETTEDIQLWLYQSMTAAAERLKAES